MEEDIVYLSQEGYNKLEAELLQLKTEERESISERLKIAKEFGDLSENSEYDEAKSAQEANEIKIAKIEATLKSAQIINEDDIDITTVQLGNKVIIENLNTKQELEYSIVSAPEVNMLENKISNNSPLAKALLGNKKGNVIKVEAPAGITEYKIKKIGLIQ